MFVFAQDMGIKNWMKILLVSTTVPPFTTVKTKFGAKVLQFSFWSILLNYMHIHEKKRMPKSNHYILKYGDSKFGQANASVCTLQIFIKFFYFPASARSYWRVRADGEFFNFYLLIFSTSARMHSRIHADATSVRTDGKNKNKNNLFLFLFLFFRVPANALTRPHGREIFIYLLIFFSTSKLTGPTFAVAGSASTRMRLGLCGQGDLPLM
jgi:hypothetical protein